MGRIKNKRPLFTPDNYRLYGLTISTAASTALEPRGVVALQSTSTSAPVVYTLQGPKAGDVLEICNSLTASSSVAPYHVNTGSGVFIASSTYDMITLSTHGAGIRCIAQSSSAWLILGTYGATISTST